MSMSAPFYTTWGTRAEIGYIFSWRKTEISTIESQPHLQSCCGPGSFSQ
jgi:hypothetical protein